LFESFPVDNNGTKIWNARAVGFGLTNNSTTTVTVQAFAICGQ
jgi:hypothetical protein